MTVKGPEAIDPAPAGPERSGGRPETAILLRDAKAAQPPAENSRGRSLREGDRDAVVLRSHRTHRGLRGRPAARRGEEPDPGSMLIGGVRGHANGHRTAAVSKTFINRPARPAPTAAACARPLRPHRRPATVAATVLQTISGLGEAGLRPCHKFRHRAASSGALAERATASAPRVRPRREVSSPPCAPAAGAGFSARPAGRGKRGSGACLAGQAPLRAAPYLTARYPADALGEAFRRGVRRSAHGSFRDRGIGSGSRAGPSRRGGPPRASRLRSR